MSSFTSPLSHFDAHGHAHMVDVSAKPATHRVAIARGWIQMLPSTLSLINAGIQKKGDVLGIARIAGIMAAKKTSALIPLCHPLSLTRIAIDFESIEHFGDAVGVACIATVETIGNTGVEIEALNAVQVALLTIFDMCKANDRGMRIKDVQVVEKSGGQSGVYSAI